MSEYLTQCLVAALVVLNCASPAFAQSSSQVDKINKWFDQNKEDQKKRDEYWKNLKTGPMQTPGEIQKAGTMQKAGTIQIPQGWKAIKTSELACQKRYAISGDTLFEFDRDTLTPHAVATLNLLVPDLKKQVSHPVTVEGHTDSIGTDEYNQQLSFHRATRVKNWLIDNKVFDKEAVKVLAQGKRIPVAPNTNPDGTDNPPGRQLNRRVEIVVNTCVTLEKPKTEDVATKKEETTTASDKPDEGQANKSGEKQPWKLEEFATKSDDSSASKTDNNATGKDGSTKEADASGDHGQPAASDKKSD